MIDDNVPTLHSYLIDVAEARSVGGDAVVQLVTYRVVSDTAQNALDKFLEKDENYLVVYTGEQVNNIVINVNVE